MTNRTKITAVAAVVLVVAVIAYMSASRKRDPGGANLSDAGALTPVPTASDKWSNTAVDPAVDAATPEIGDANLASADGKTIIVARWGSGRGEMGRDRPAEGNPEGPMSLVLAGRDLLVLDQVNGRLARYDSEGRLQRTSDVPTTVQDVAVAKDGTVVMVDRMAGKAITLVDPNGRKIGELPLGPKMAEPGLVTAVLVDGKNVYVEKEHGALVLIGSTDGKPAPDDAAPLSGRPSKDGALLLTAGLSSKAQGKAYLNAIDRKTGALKFARAIQFPRPAQAIVLLDSDAKGTLYLGVAAGDPGDAHIACLDGGDGHVLGRIVLPLSHTPEESFRDFTVGDDGTIAFVVRTEENAQYRTAHCP